MEVKIDYLAIGKRIRTARLSKEMTQETLSNMIDVAPTYVSSIENGHTIPVAMKYCVVKLDAKKAGNKVKRWQAISESAAKQSKRSRIPEVHAVMNFKDAVEYAKLQDMILVPYENERGMEATREALKKVKPGQSISVFIGPEGGFSEEEIDALRQDAEVLSLGKRILRTDTAAICAMSMLMLELEEKTEGEC